MAGKMAEEVVSTVGAYDASAAGGIGAVAGTAVALLPMLLGGIKNKPNSSPVPKLYSNNNNNVDKIMTSQPTFEFAGEGKVFVK